MVLELASRNTIPLEWYLVQPVCGGRWFCEVSDFIDSPWKDLPFLSHEWVIWGRMEWKEGSLIGDNCVKWEKIVLKILNKKGWVFYSYLIQCCSICWLLQMWKVLHRCHDCWLHQIEQYAGDDMRMTNYSASLKNLLKPKSKELNEIRKCPLLTSLQFRFSGYHRDTRTM